MFKDYYKILDVSERATLQELKWAFKKQALKWHPDQNTGRDTTIQMQEINEAYLILKDAEARERYNKEYQRFKKTQEYHQHSNCNQEKNSTQNANNVEDTFIVNDDILNDWIKNAQRQSIDLAKKTIKEMGGLLYVGAKAFLQKLLSLVITGFILGGTLLLMAKGCGQV